MFPKKFKNVSTKQLSVSGATFKAWLFLSVFNFACKDSQVTKDSQASSYMWQSSWIHHAWKLVRFCVKPVFFLLILKCGHLYQKSLCFSLLFFIDYPFRRLLPLSCFYGSSQQLFNIKVTSKRASFIKK